jgi:hypothetical protein
VPLWISQISIHRKAANPPTANRLNEQRRGIAPNNASNVAAYRAFSAAVTVVPERKSHVTTTDG